MAFSQYTLSRVSDQSRGIFDKFVYKTDDTLTAVLVDGYFDKETFGYYGIGSEYYVIDVIAAGEYATLLMDLSDYTVEQVGSSGGVSTQSQPAAEQRQIVYLGDSITAQTIDTNGWYRSYGYPNWLNQLTGQRFEMVDVIGYPGQTATYIASQTHLAVATGADACFVLAGTNDMIDTVDLSTTLAAYDSIIEQLKAGGIFPVFLTVFPNNLGTEAGNLKAQQFNSYLKELQKAGEIGLVDTCSAVQDGLHSIPDDSTYDGVHPNHKGAFKMAWACMEYLNDIYPESRLYDKDGADNQIPNPYFDGTTGTVLGTDLTGSAPTGWFASNETGLLGTVGIEDTEVGSSIKSVVFDVTSTVIETGVTLQVVNIPLPVGTYYATAEMYLEGDLDFIGFELKVQAFSGDTFEIRGFDTLGIDVSVPLPNNKMLKAKTGVFEITTADQPVYVTANARLAEGAGRVVMRNIKVSRV